MPGTLLNAVVRALTSTAAVSTVSITNGTVRGGICASNEAASYFHGIPYAKPPTGDLRFAPPQAYSSKFPNGGLNATQPAPSCIQFGSEGKENGQTSEDCLYVDVWKPTNATKKSNLPVRVFLYGGSNTDGGISDPAYDGCNVASNAVMVSINYRLGPLGFLALDSAGIVGNQGVQDIVQGLAWVQSNIQAFGGNPKKVVLHGQSAGAIDAFTVATLPQASELMSAFISESGGGRHAPQSSSAQSLGKSYAQSLQCAANDTKCLRSKSTDELVKGFANLPVLNAKKLAAIAVDAPADARFTPFVDGKIVPTQPGDQPVRIPSIFGSNAFEGTLFSLAQFNKTPASATSKDYRDFLSENFGYQAKDVAQRYPLESFNTTKYPAFYAISQIITDSSFLCPAFRALDAASSHNVNAWAYLFSTTPHCSWTPDVPESDISALGATHGAELPFMLNHTSRLPQPSGSCSMSADEQKIASFMTAAWTEMAASQRPVQNAKDWPMFGSASSSQGIEFANETAIGVLSYTACNFWNSINAIQVIEAQNGTNVTAMELPKTHSHSKHLTTETKTVTGPFTITTTTKENGKEVTITKTSTGAHAVTTTAEVNSSHSHHKHETTVVEVVDGAYTYTTTSEESGRIVTVTRTTTGSHSVTTTKEPQHTRTHDKHEHDHVTTITHSAEHAHTTTMTNEDGHVTTITEKSQSGYTTTETVPNTPSSSSGSSSSSSNSAISTTSSASDGTPAAVTTNSSSASTGVPPHAPSGNSDVVSNGAAQATASFIMLMAALVTGYIVM